MDRAELVRIDEGKMKVLARILQVKCLKRNNWEKAPYWHSSDDELLQYA